MSLMNLNIYIYSFTTKGKKKSTIENALVRFDTDFTQDIHTPILGFLRRVYGLYSIKRCVCLDCVLESLKQSVLDISFYTLG
jgi:hypothetical protein